MSHYHTARKKICKSQCTYSYTFFLQKLDIDECSSQPCQNNGICEDRENSYSCDCDLGYTGLDCETGNERALIILLYHLFLSLTDLISANVGECTKYWCRVSKLQTILNFLVSASN